MLQGSQAQGKATTVVSRTQLTRGAKRVCAATVQDGYETAINNNAWQAGAVWWSRPGVEHFNRELWMRDFVVTTDFPTLHLQPAPEGGGEQPQNPELQNPEGGEQLAGEENQVSEQPAGDGQPAADGQSGEQQQQPAAEVEGQAAADAQPAAAVEGEAAVEAQQTTDEQPAAEGQVLITHLRQSAMLTLHADLNLTGSSDSLLL